MVAAPAPLQSPPPQKLIPSFLLLLSLDSSDSHVGFLLRLFFLHQSSSFLPHFASQPGMQQKWCEGKTAFSQNEETDIFDRTQFSLLQKEAPSPLLLLSPSKL